MSWTHRGLPALTVALGLGLAFLPVLRARTADAGLDLTGLGEVPASFAGRVKPLDSVARTSLLVLSGRETLRHEGRSLAAIEWLAGLLARPADWEKVPTIRIDHPDVLALVGRTASDPKLLSFTELVARADEITRQASLASGVEPDRRDLFQRRVLQLYEQVVLYHQLANLTTLRLVPPAAPGGQWATPAEAGPDARASTDAVLAALRAGDGPGLTQALGAHDAALVERVPGPRSDARLEAAFNRADPFTSSVALYVLAFVLSCISWLRWRSALARAGLALIVVALVVHTLGLGTRVYLMGRPPVTNLYSSAVFIGWGCVLLSLGLEARFRNGVGTLSAAITGVAPLLVARGLAAEGDTMATLQAVLDTNFWLATHVIVIALGYSATFLAGFIGAAFVVRGVLTRSLDHDAGRALHRMIYGIICFSVVFSFLGTVLGGIWADQSWGRFWGWDPKENGALILVLWGATALHGQWGGLYRARGLACMAIIGNIVVAWSWFGTNMLGVGLHSYGFMDGAAGTLVAFAASQVLLVALAAVPPGRWRSPAALGLSAAEPARRAETTRQEPVLGGATP